MSMIIHLPVIHLIGVNCQSEGALQEPEQVLQPISRLPRRASIQPSVAELIKKYSEYLPPQGVEELARTAFPPAVTEPEPESEQESAADTRKKVRHGGRRRFMHRRSSASDFEQSYAANIAPKYLTHSRRPLVTAPYSTRIPGPAISSIDSRDTSRRTSPDKRASLRRSNTDYGLRASGMSPPPQKSLGLTYGKATRRKPSIRNVSTDKASLSRPTSSSGLRAPPVKRNSGPGTKVSTIAKHFERIGKENERANRRYVVIRGRRARPVASARGKVEVLESIKDVIKDESESSEYSDADDEGGEDDNPASTSVPKEVNPTDPGSLKREENGVEETPTAGLSTAPMQESPQSPQESPITRDLNKHASTSDDRSQPPVSVPGSPMLTATGQGQNVLLTPPIELDTGTAGTERHSILKALSGFWPQQFQPPRHRADADPDDPMSDPEHIFRESSMVVRIDEPTSIIALALKYVLARRFSQS